MYTKITMVSYVKQGEDDIEYSKKLDAKGLNEHLKSMEDSGRLHFQNEGMIVESLKVELVEEMGK